MELTDVKLVSLLMRSKHGHGLRTQQPRASLESHNLYRLAAPCAFNQTYVEEWDMGEVRGKEPQLVFALRNTWRPPTDQEHDTNAWSLNIYVNVKTVYQTTLWGLGHWVMLWAHPSPAFQSNGEIHVQFHGVTGRYRLCTDDSVVGACIAQGVRGVMPTSW